VRWLGSTSIFLVSAPLHVTMHTAAPSFSKKLTEASCIPAPICEVVHLPPTPDDTIRLGTLNCRITGSFTWLQRQASTVLYLRSVPCSPPLSTTTKPSMVRSDPSSEAVQKV
jgi:hypothetical protein